MRVYDESSKLGADFPIHEFLELIRYENPFSNID